MKHPNFRAVRLSDRVVAEVDARIAAQETTFSNYVRALIVADLEASGFRGTQPHHDAAENTGSGVAVEPCPTPAISS